MTTSVVRHLRGQKLAELLGDWTGGGARTSRGLRQAVRQLVFDGRLPPSTRLPAEREMATSLQVSRTLVARALEQLREDGVVASRRGSGSWITVPEHGDASPSMGWYPVLNAELLDLAQATPCAPPELSDAVERAGARFGEHFAAHGYQPYGLASLRQRIADRYTQRGLPTTAEQVVITNGAQHAFSLTLRTLVAPGERVMVEDPTYPNAIHALRSMNAIPVAVPLDGSGWDMEAVEATLRQAAPRLAYFIPDFHNPTGARMTDRDRQRLGTALRRNRTVAVIDETLVDIDLGEGPAPLPMACFAAERVVSIGSAGKSFWGGIRLGWLRAPEDLVHRIVQDRAAVDLGSPVFEQLVLEELLRDPEPGLRRRREAVRTRRDFLVDLLTEHFPQWRFHVPGGGLSLWCDLGAPVSGRLAIAAEQHGVRIAPGARFAVNGSSERYLRVPFSLPPERLEEAVSRLALASASVGRYERGGPLDVAVT